MALPTGANGFAPMSVRGPGYQGREGETMNATCDELECVVDKIGLTKTLEMLEQICYDKADHLRSNWQDEQAARAWDKAATKIGVVIATAARECV